ncbi:glycoside hydrolase family 3 C-terminal domain-containing protein [Bacillus sp. sid0103]|uniref:glycoside hydrolase family 3 C-terminal domain-containing protein n=1 Tax=Bacillus sp. sid0103 TaxID=2856337 RepID=UPI001C4575AA|nr:glycoside hydrolase family 3 C-terminal domain-containing protein [Bacillus sp. sid0103]MBV7506146.1 glycoside hydrolase family 3 C-terminal domain-containing protein [Bacillus sp. sid0103]
MRGYYKVLSSSMFTLMLLSSGSGVLAEEQPPLQVNAAAVTTDNGSVQTGAVQEQTPMLVDQASIPAVIRAMTLDEKVDLIGGAGAAVTGAAGGTFPIPRLGIPKLTFADGPAGLRFGSTANKSTTGFPIPSALSASFNKDLMYQVSSAMGKETLDYGVDVILGPALNIHRDPRGGRNFEYYSEDPYLSGEMAAEFTKGVQDQGVGVSMKHFAANNQETNRQSVNEIISERALREIYLSGFERVVKEAHPWTVMSSYNSINGPFSAHNSWLLNDVLRSDWGFNGMVMTDWGGSKNNGIAMLNGGNDLSMPSLSVAGKTAVKAAILDGSLKEVTLDTAIENILNLIVKSPTFKKLSTADNTKLSVSSDLASADAKLSREAAPEGMVLLKNENKALPFDKKVKKVGIVGNSYTMPSCGFGTPASACTTDNAASKMFLMGTGSAYVTPTHTVQLPEGLKNGGYIPVNTNASGAEVNENLTAEDAAYMAQNSDIGVIVIARGSGEGADGNETTFEPSAKESELIKKVTDAYHTVNKKVVVVLNVGAPFNTVSWRDSVDSILLSWQPGMEAGNALTDVLSGKAYPSGKLPETFPVKLEDAPSYANFPSSDGNPNLVNYKEDIYVGYRYYSTFNKQTAYEFGYGLSYTTFDYSDFKLNKDTLSNKIKVSFKVANTGSLVGKEAPQLYVSAPDGKLEKPAIELKAFGKTRELKPGQKETFNFFIDPKDIASFDESTSSWIVEKGTYKFKVGASSVDIRGTLDFKVDKEIIAEVDNDNGPDVQLETLSKYNQ